MANNIINIEKNNKSKGEVASWNSKICYTLIDKGISQSMISDIEKSIKTKKEIGYNIDKNFNITDKCVGHKCSVKIKSPKESFGNFHTHPSSTGDTSFSDTDLKDTFNKGYTFSCVGTKDENYGYVRCVEINKNEEYKELQNKNDKLKKILKEYIKSDSKTKLKMLQEKKLKDNPVIDILKFMKKQKDCLIRYDLD